MTHIYVVSVINSTFQTKSVQKLNFDCFQCRGQRIYVRRSLIGSPNLGQKLLWTSWTVKKVAHLKGRIVLGRSSALSRPCKKTFSSSNRTIAGHELVEDQTRTKIYDKAGR